MARRKRKTKRQETSATAPPSSNHNAPQSVTDVITESMEEVKPLANTETADAAKPDTAVNPLAEELACAPSPLPAGSPSDGAEPFSTRDLENRFAVITDLLRQTMASESSLEERENQLRLREAELSRRSQDLDDRRREHAGRLRQHRQLSSAGETLAGQADRFTTLLQLLTETIQRQSEQSYSDSQETTAALESLAAEVESKQQAVESLSHELESEQQRNRQLQAEIDQHLCERLFDTEPSELQDEPLRQKLVDAQTKLAELEQQNEELASKLADDKVRGQIASGSSGAVNESLSWEERKQLIMQRLENEDQTMSHNGSSEATAALDELQALRTLVQATDNEIVRRDSEIAELRQLLEQQSSTVGDVAIGAAAIAGLLDQDDLVREERKKLQQIQTEWQDKLRQAEIEVSLERAKLARERQDIEKRNIELADRMLELPGGSPRTPEVDDNGKPTRKWLAKLGLDK